MSRPKPRTSFGALPEKQHAPSPAIKQRSAIPLDQLDAVVGDGLEIVRAVPLAELPVTEWNAKDHVVVRDHRYPLNTLVEVELEHVSGIFKGNKRRALNNIEDLALNIAAVGRNTEPVKLRLDAAGSGFEVVKGQRRFTAMKRACELKGEPLKLTALIVEIDDASATLEAATENLYREDLTLWERSDQMIALQESGVAQTAEDLVPYLPTNGDKKKDRTLVYYYLTPSKIPSEVRQFVDEGQGVAMLKIKQLKEAIESAGGRQQAMYEHLANHCLRDQHTVADLLKRIQAFLQSDDSPKPEIRTITNHEGKSLAVVKHSPKGTTTLRFEKAVSPGRMKQILETVEKMLAEDETAGV
jgi:hypothetical protein